MNDEVRIQRRINRERKARKEAERLLEQKSLELYSVNNSLLEAHKELQSRTAELQEINARLEAEVILKQRTQEILEDHTHKLAQTRDRAEMANRAKSTFLATMSHELRTPLNAIIGYTEMTLEDLLEGIVSKDMIRDVKRIGSAGSHLLHLINAILDLSKIETGEEEIIVEEISVKELLDEVVKLSWPLAEKSENRLEIKISDRIQQNIVSDRKKLCQIMVNLVGNATKFTENGTIILSADLANNLESIEFFVEDTGIGIPEDQVDSIFEPFRQLDNSYNRKYSGSGLGLAISKAYCSLIGGDINYQKGELGGARFNVTIPYSLVSGK